MQPIQLCHAVSSLVHHFVSELYVITTMFCVYYVLPDTVKGSGNMSLNARQHSWLATMTSMVFGHHSVFEHHDALAYLFCPTVLLHEASFPDVDETRCVLVESVLLELRGQAHSP